jgi:hypothetical protein
MAKTTAKAKTAPAKKVTATDKCKKPVAKKK